MTWVNVLLYRLKLSCECLSLGLDMEGRVLFSPSCLPHENLQLSFYQWQGWHFDLPYVSQIWLFFSGWFRTQEKDGTDWIPWILVFPAYSLVGSSWKTEALQVVPALLHRCCLHWLMNALLVKRWYCKGRGMCKVQNVWNKHLDLVNFKIAPT